MSQILGIIQRTLEAGEKEQEIAQTPKDQYGTI